MNTIKIFLSESGRVSNLLKDFPLYKGQFNDKLLNVYVPTSILAPSFAVQHYIGQTTVSTDPTDEELASFVAYNTYPSREPEQGDIVEINNVTTDKFYIYEFDGTDWTATEVNSFGTLTNIAGTSVKVGMIATKRNGTIYQSKSYFMRYLKTLTYQGVEYALYERKLPKEFTSFVGQGENAPTIIANVVNVDTSDNAVTSLVTSQTCKLDVMQSSMLDQDETIEAGDLEVLTAEVNNLSAEMPLKQDKIDDTLNTTTKSVVGAINSIYSDTATNTSDIATNSQDIADIKLEQVAQNGDIATNTYNIGQNALGISDLQGRVQTLEQTAVTGETYIGTMTSSATLPTDEQLSAYVLSVAGRQPKGGDYVYFTQIITGGTDKNYKYTYSSVDGWGSSEIPGVEKSSNSDYGIVKGTYGDSTKNTQVNINDGEILDIRVKDNSNNLRDVREYLNSNATSLGTNTTDISGLKLRMTSEEGKTSTLQGQMSNILDGTTAVAKANSAINDGLNRNIAQTYMTQSAGATKQDIKNYALPKAFNDVSFIGANNEMVDTVPDSVSALYTATSTSVGETTLCYVQKTIGDVEYQLASKNSYSNAIYVTASANCSVQFSVVTSIYDSEDENWLIGNIELTDVVSMTANEIKKVNFGSPLNYLNSIVNIKQGDIIQQTFSVVTTVSETISFDVYSNEVYPSTFYLNTTSQVVTTQAGDLGEIPVYGLSGTYDSGTNTITFNASASATINENTYCLFKCSYADPIATGTKINIGYGLSTLRIITPPYNKSSSADATIDDFDSFYTAGVGLEFEGVIQNISGNLVVYATMGGGSGGSGQTITINTTTGSESISDGTNTLNVETRNTAQTITAQKTHTAPFTVDIQTSEGDTSVEEGLNVGGGLDMFSAVVESTEGTETTTTQAQSGLYSGYPVMGVSQTVVDSSTQEESTVDHSVMVTENGVFVDGENIETTYQKQTDNNLNTTNKTIVGAINELQSGQTAIDDVIPAQASLSNQLADKNFVNSSVATNTANFLGTFETLGDLSTYIDTHTATVTNNDYAFVTNSLIEYNGGDFPDKATMDSYVATNILNYTNYDYAWVVNGTKFDLYYLDILTDPEEMVLKASNVNKSDITIETFYNRYKYNKTANTINFEYTLNNTQFTANQWASINSGITSADVTQIGTNTTNITNLQTNKVDSVSYASATKKMQQTKNGTTTDIVTFGDNAFTNTHIPVYTEESQTIASNSWHALISGSDVYKYTATVNITHTIGADTEVGIAVDNVLQFAEYGFAIGLVAAQNIDVYSAKQPSNSVTLTFTFKD